LNALLEKKAQYIWSDSCEEAFRTLKIKLLSASILAFPQIDCDFILDTDSSNYGIGDVLSQIQDGKERVIGYFSKSLNKTSYRSYCVTRRELLALVASVRHFNCYLYGRKFTVRTDHSSLRWLRNFKNPKGQLARWLESLSEYDFIIEHRKGRSHLNADGLSRRPCSEQNCRYCEKVEQKIKATITASMKMKNVSMW